MMITAITSTPPATPHTTAIIRVVLVPLLDELLGCWAPSGLAVVGGILIVVKGSGSVVKNCGVVVVVVVVERGWVVVTVMDETITVGALGTDALTELNRAALPVTCRAIDWILETKAVVFET